MELSELVTRIICSFTSTGSKKDAIALAFFGIAECCCTLIWLISCGCIEDLAQ